MIRYYMMSINKVITNEVIEEAEGAFANREPGIIDQSYHRRDNRSRGRGSEDEPECAVNT